MLARLDVPVSNPIRAVAETTVELEDPRQPREHRSHRTRVSNKGDRDNVFRSRVKANMAGRDSRSDLELRLLPNRHPTNLSPRPLVF